MPGSKSGNLSLSVLWFFSRGGGDGDGSDDEDTRSSMRV